MVWGYREFGDVTVNNAHGNTAGPYVVEAAIPFDFLPIRILRLHLQEQL